MCILWHKNCITSLACLPWYLRMTKMFLFALLAYGNHEPYFFPLCVCVYTCILKSFHMTFSFFLTKRNILHEKDKCKHSFSLFVCLVFFNWLRKFLALIGFLWVWSITELCMEDTDLKSSGFTVWTSVACHLTVILDSAWNRLEWFSQKDF